MPVERDVGVGEVVHDHHLARPGELDERLHERGVDARVVGLCGNDVTITRGRGHAARTRRRRFARSPAPAPWHLCDPRAGEDGPKMWIG